MTSSESHSFIRIATFARIDAIAIGFLAYLLMEEIKVKHLLVAIAPCIAGVVSHYIFRNQISVIFFVYSTNILFGIVCALLYKWESIHPSSSKLFQRVAKLIGQLSYSVYVLHIIMIEFTHSFGFAVYITVTLAVSAVIYSNFEKPILLMRPKYGRF